MTSSSRSPSPPTSSSPGDGTGAATDGAADAICDVRGEVCPFTFVRAKLALEALPIGATLRVVVDHEPAVRNLPRSAEAWGQEVVSVRQDGAACWTIELRKLVR